MDARSQNIEPKKLVNISHKSRFPTVPIFAVLCSKRQGKPVLSRSGIDCHAAAPDGKVNFRLAALLLFLTPTISFLFANNYKHKAHKLL